MSTNTIRAILLIYLGLIVGVVSGYVVGFTIYQPQISQLESDISTKDTQISQLQSNLTDVQNNITSLQGQINALNSTLLNTQTELEEAIVNITSLETQLEETQAELMPGRIPILHVGDYWITEFVDNATTYTVTQNITGEGTDYYLMYSAYDPPYRGMINSTGWLDKSTLNPVRMQGHSNYTYDTTTTPYTYNSTILYTYQGGVPFPLIVGKEFNMTETIAYNMTMNSTTYTYIMNNSYTYKVEAIENVTVPAGTFTCFRMNYYNATSGDLIYIFWWSDVVKNAVKHMDYSTTLEMTYELKDYSV